MSGEDLAGNRVTAAFMRQVENAAREAPKCGTESFGESSLRNLRTKGILIQQTRGMRQFESMFRQMVEQRRQISHICQKRAISWLWQLMRHRLDSFPVRARVRTMQEQRNTDKVAAAIHYLVARFPAHQLGATKLNKILWFADCEYYARHGCSLTGETHYVRKDQGPWLGRFDSAVAQLLLHDAITERRVRVINFHRREFYPRQEPDVSIFSSEELDTLVKVASELTPSTAEEVAQSSHKLLWDCVPPNGKMSVAAGAVGGKPLDDSDMGWARSALA